MVKSKMKQRIIALLLSVAMTILQIPTFADGDSSPAIVSTVVTGFESLDLDIMFQYVPYGTLKEDLELPATLKATVTDAVYSSGEERILEIEATWNSSPEYDGDEPGAYAFTPEFSGDITFGDDVAAPTINIIVDSPEFVPDDDAGIGLPKSAGTWVLQQLAAGAVSYIGGVAMEEAMAQIFGRPPSEIDKLVSELKDVKDGIEEIKGQINELISKVDQTNLKNDLRMHWELMSRFTGVYGALCGSIEDLKGDKMATDIFLTELYKASDENYKVDGMSIINATITLGNALTRSLPGGKYNIFGAFDKLDKYTHRWEHQGYEQRNTFRDEAIITYSLFSAYSQLAAKAILLHNQGDSAEEITERYKANRWLKELQDNALKVSEMEKRCAVIEHPNLRIYRDTKKGVDLYTFYTEVQKSRMYNSSDPEWKKFTGNITWLAHHSFLYPLSKTERYNKENVEYGVYTVYSQQPSHAIYKRLYDDCKSDYGKEFSLYSIFFDKDKGSFTEPPGKGLPHGRFICNYYTWAAKPLIYPLYYGTWTMTWSKGFDEQKEQLLYSMFDVTTNSLLDLNINEDILEYYSPIYYYGKVDQGLPMGPTPETSQGLVIFDLKGGTRTGGGELLQIVDEGTDALEPIVYRRGYTFLGWDRSFDNVTSDMTVTAVWGYDRDDYYDDDDDDYDFGNSEKNSSIGEETKVEVILPKTDETNSPVQVEVEFPSTIDESGNARASITPKAITDAFEKAYTIAKKNSLEQNGIALLLRVDTGKKDVLGVAVSLPKSVLDIIASKKIESITIAFNNSDIKIGLDLEAVRELNKQIKLEMNMTVSRKDNSKLNGEAKDIIGDRPVFDINIYHDDDKEFTVLDTGNITVNIPYTLDENEISENVKAVYVDDGGNVHWIMNSVYDSTESTISFTTDHFSIFGVGYKKPRANFVDTVGHWAKEDIDFVVDRGLFSGISNNYFGPDSTMTRGMFLTVLGRFAKADASGYIKSSFTDVEENSYYLGYIEWALKNNIVNGVGNGKFKADSPITREQMVTILSKYTDVMAFPLPILNNERIFSDTDKISAYAKESVRKMQMAGIVSGKNGNVFDPQGTATRAEVSRVFKGCLDIIED